MPDTARKLCLICLTTNKDDKISNSSNFIEVFIKLINVKEFKKTLWLCMWCRSTLKRTEALKRVAAYSEKILWSLEPMILADVHHHRSLHTFVYTDVKHIDIQPNSFVKAGQEINAENIDETNNINGSEKVNDSESNTQTMKEILNFNEVLLKETTSHPTSFLNEEINDGNVETEVSNKTFLNGENKTQSRKKKKTKIKNDQGVQIWNKEQKWSLSDMKIEVKFLSYEEQMEQIEKKKSKFKNMKFQCEHCGVGFMISDYFEKHKLRHTEAAGPHKCSLCLLHFKSKLVLSQHMLCHKRQFHCQTCGVRFNKRSYCTVHSYKCAGNLLTFELPKKVQHRVNNLQSRYPCSQCDAVPKTKQRLDVHVRSVHLGLKPFTCGHCSSSFATNSNLKSHYAVHSNVSEYYCVECNTYYKTDKNLRRHLNESVRHLGDRNSRFTCKKCGKAFVSSKSLQQHILRHSNTQVFTCPQCSKIFSSKSNLNKHVKCIHRVVDS